MLLRISLLLSPSCASVPDFQACVEINYSKGYCTNVISGKEQVISDSQKIDGKTWFDIRPTMVLIPYRSYADLKKYIIKQCKLDNRCKELTSWERTINSIDKKIQEKTLPVDVD